MLLKGTTDNPNPANIYRSITQLLRDVFVNNTHAATSGMTVDPLLSLLTELLPDDDELLTEHHYVIERNGRVFTKSIAVSVTTSPDTAKEDSSISTLTAACQISAVTKSGVHSDF